MCQRFTNLHVSPDLSPKLQTNTANCLTDIYITYPLFEQETTPKIVTLTMINIYFMYESGGQLVSARQFSLHRELSCSCVETMAGNETISESSLLKYLSPRLKDLDSWRSEPWAIVLYMYVCGH